MLGGHRNEEYKNNEIVWGTIKTHFLCILVLLEQLKHSSFSFEIKG